MNMCNESRPITAKERVEIELEELTNKIVKLTQFIFSKNLYEIVKSREMVYELKDQLRVMQEYACILQERLRIWDKTDDDFDMCKRILSEVKNG